MFNSVNTLCLGSANCQKSRSERIYRRRKTNFAERGLTLNGLNLLSSLIFSCHFIIKKVKGRFKFFDEFW